MKLNRDEPLTESVKLSKSVKDELEGLKAIPQERLNDVVARAIIALKNAAEPSLEKSVA